MSDKPLTPEEKRTEAMILAALDESLRRNPPPPPPPVTDRRVADIVREGRGTHRIPEHLLNAFCTFVWECLRVHPQTPDLMLAQSVRDVISQLPKLEASPFSVPLSVLLRPDYIAHVRASSIILQQFPNIDASPYGPLWATPVPVSLPWHEHGFLFAKSGHGKTQAIEFLLDHHFKEVAAGRASVVLMDSQEALIPKIARLSYFAPGQPLHGKLTLLDAADVEFPIALNLFDLGIGDLAAASPRDREQAFNASLEMLTYMMEALLGFSFTSKQGGLAQYLVQAVMHIPGANILTLRELLDPVKFETHRPHLAAIEGIGEFFETYHPAKGPYAHTREEILTRLDKLTGNRNWRRLFLHQRSKFRMFEELQEGRVILINTAASLLQPEGCEVFGRFFIALLGMAVERRAPLSDRTKMPTYFYIDEAHDYIANDARFERILKQARKQKVGAMVATQEIEKLANILPTLLTNTSIKLAAKLENAALARNMRTDIGFILNQQKAPWKYANFACYLDNITPQAITITLPFGVWDNVPPMSDDDYDDFLVKNRERVSGTPNTSKPPSPKPARPKAPDTSKASTKW